MLRHNSFIKAEVKICRLRIVKIEKILTVTYRTLLPKTTNFLKNGGCKKLSSSKDYFLFRKI